MLLNLSPYGGHLSTEGISMNDPNLRRAVLADIVTKQLGKSIIVNAMLAEPHLFTNISVKKYKPP